MASRCRWSMLWSAALLLAWCPFAAAQPPGPGDWASWRGPTGNGVAAAGQTPPVRWSDTEGIAWRTEIPGRGHSSPTVVRDRIYLTTADEQAKTQSVLALDRASGKLIWQKQLSQGGFPQTHAKNTHATPTIACDGERLFVLFHHHDKLDAIALTLAGEVAWRRDLGAFVPKQYLYGYAPSPALYGDLVLISAEFDGAGAGYLTALKRATGDVVWKTPRPTQTSYSSPIVGKAAGRDQLLISGCNLVSAFDPANGKPLWSTPGTTAATCGTMVWDGDLVFASGGYPKSETLCVRADGSGQVLWKNNQKCYEQSMLVHEGHVYALNDNGIAFCWRGQDGAEMWKERLRGPISSSPVFSNGNVYQTDEHGTTYVFKARPDRFELISKNQLGVEGFATLAICNSEIFIRVVDDKGGKRQESLVCLRGKPPAKLTSYQPAPAPLTADFPRELVEFASYRENPVFKAEGPGFWDVKIRERGWILREGNRWRMWYTGYDGERQGKKLLGYAESKDGLHWTPNANNPIYSTDWVEDMQVVRHGEQYYMFAEGRDDVAQLLSSPDGLSWKRVGPLDIRMKNGDPISAGPRGTPTAYFEDGLWRLYYERKDLGVWLATSRDMKVWTNVSDDPVLGLGPDAYDKHAVAMNQVVKHQGQYYAYYHASDSDQPGRKWSTCIARSSDLVTWHKYAKNPILSDNKSSGIVVDDGAGGLRLYTMHDVVQAHLPPPQAK